MTDYRLRFVIPPSVVNHSKPYIIAMISAAVEYWCRPPSTAYSIRFLSSYFP